MLLGAKPMRLGNVALCSHHVTMLGSSTSEGNKEKLRKEESTQKCSNISKGKGQLLRLPLPSNHSHAQRAHWGPSWQHSHAGARHQRRLACQATPASEALESCLRPCQEPAKKRMAGLDIIVIVIVIVILIIIVIVIAIIIIIISISISITIIIVILILILILIIIIIIPELSKNWKVSKKLPEPGPCSDQDHKHATRTGELQT